MSNYLVGLEVFGFDKVEPAILAALVVKRKGAEYIFLKMQSGPFCHIPRSAHLCFACNVN